MTSNTDIELTSRSQESKPKNTAAERLQRGSVRASGKPGYAVIMIPKTDRDTHDVFASHNFIPYQIKRGVDVEVPVGVIEALDLAVGQTWIEEEDPVTRRKTLVPQETQTVPFSVRRGALAAA